MGFYDLSKEERVLKYQEIQKKIEDALHTDNDKVILFLFSDEDTYIRKAAYLGISKIYFEKTNLDNLIIQKLLFYMDNSNEKVRQTSVNSAGEIAKKDFKAVESIFEKGLIDSHHSVRNAIQGSLKKAGDKNPKEILPYINSHILSKNSEIRREVAHGLELYGRTHPLDILPILKKIQFEENKRVYPMVVHIIGQISYRKENFYDVVDEIVTWDNPKIINDSINEIIEHHKKAKTTFKSIDSISYSECLDYVNKKIKDRE